LRVVTTDCRRCGQPVGSGQNFCPSCGLSLRDTFPLGSSRAVASDAPDGRQKRRRRRRIHPRTVRIAGQLVAGVISGVVSGLVALYLGLVFFKPVQAPIKVSVLTPTPFGEQTAKGPVNASAIVPLGDSSFLVVDDLTDDTFFELRFAPDGTKSGPLVPHKISGLSSSVAEDFEGATLVQLGDLRYVVATSSLEGNEGENTENGLVRVRIMPDGTLVGEPMRGFRTWLVNAFPEIAQADHGRGALNVGGIAWDPDRGTLKLGIRFPTDGERPLVLEIRVADWARPWDVANLERAGLYRLDVGPGDAGTPRGILDLVRDPNRREFFVIAGDSTGKAKHGGLFVWDGSSGVRPVPSLAFHPDMKPEGLAFGTIGGRPGVVVVDDTGAYYVVWASDLDAHMAASGSSRPGAASQAPAAGLSPSTTPRST
jgi:hypothetical protein